MRLAALQAHSATRSAVYFQHPVEQKHPVRYLVVGNSQDLLDDVTHTRDGNMRAKGKGFWSSTRRCAIRASGCRWRSWVHAECISKLQGPASEVSHQSLQK